MNIALISPNKEQFSETFIQAHRVGFKGEIHFLAGGKVPVYSDKTGALKLKGVDRIINSIYSRLTKNTLSGDLLAFKNYLKENKIQVVYAEYGPTGVAVLQACKDVNIPLIVNFHGRDAFAYDELENNKEGYQQLVRDAAAIVVVSQEMKAQLTKLGAPREKLYYTPCAPNDEFLTINKEIVEPPFFLFVGRFVSKKAPLTVIKSFELVLLEYPGAQLKMVGDGVLLEECKAFVNDKGITDSVQFKGVCARGEILTLQKECFAFVQHSVVTETGDREGTPVGVLEAMATGTVVISTYHGGIQDVVTDKVTGLLSNEGDVEAMAENMKRVLSDKTLVTNLGEQAKKEVEAKYSMTHHIQTLNNLLQKIVSI